MSDLPKTQRVRILDGKRAGEVGLFEKTYPDGMSSILINGSQVTFCRQYVALTALEEAQLIAKARGTDPAQGAEEVESGSPNVPEPKKHRGRIPGSKNKPKPEPIRAPQERPIEDAQSEPMEIQPAITPVVGRIEQLEPVERTSLGVVPREMRTEEALTNHVPVPTPAPLLIVVELSGTVVISTPVTKDNVMGIIRSLIDLTEGGQ